MKTRIVVALIMIPIVLLPIFLGWIWSVALFLLVALIASHEFATLLAAGGYKTIPWFGYAWVAGLVLSAWQPELLPLSTVLTVGLILAFTIVLFQPEQPLQRWLATVAPSIYLGVMISQALALRLLPDGLMWLMFAILITWANDTVAYFSGVTLGKRPLWPRLSPKKTWEGTVGGWLGAAVVGALLAGLMPITISPLIGAALGLIGGVLALFGDLTISLVKRQVGAKDSGTMFPGHGGMLDRLDSILFVVPFIYQVVLVFQL